MKTDVNQLIFCTLTEAQHLLNVNDPGYTIVLEGDKAVIRDRAGFVIAEIDQHGVDAKELLHG